MNLGSVQNYVDSCGDGETGGHVILERAQGRRGLNKGILLRSVHILIRGGGGGGDRPKTLRGATRVLGVDVVRQFTTVGYV